MISATTSSQLWHADGCGRHAGLAGPAPGLREAGRLTENFSAAPEGYEKVEHTLTGEQLVPREASYCPLERRAMLWAVLVRFYKESMTHSSSPMEARESRESLEIYSRLSIAEAQQHFDQAMGLFPRQ